MLLLSFEFIGIMKFYLNNLGQIPEFKNNKNNQFKGWINVNLKFIGKIKGISSGPGPVL